MGNKYSYSLAELASILKAELRGDPDCMITGLATLKTAEPGQITFLDNPRYRQHLLNTRASAVILMPSNADLCQTASLVVDNPYSAYAKVATLFDNKPKFEAGIHPSAIVDPSARVSSTASIGPNCVIGADVVVGDNVVIDSNTVVGEGCIIGAESYLASHVSVYYRVRIGSRTTIHSGVVIGSDGFGMVKEEGRWRKIPQLGSVVIGDDVEIGANTTIDRGALDDTVIHDGVKLDNQIQVAHNVEIGAHTVIAGCVGIAGSAKIGQHCMIAGGAGVVGHITIADGTCVTAMTMVNKSIETPGVYSSGVVGVQMNREWRKNVVRFKQLDEFARRLSEIEKSVSSRMQDE